MANGNGKPSGCCFMFENVGTRKIFTPEDFSEEQRMFAKTTKDFNDKEVEPLAEKLEEKNFNLNVELMKKAGDLGLLMIDVPEKYGGMGLDKSTTMLVTEYMSGSASFAVTYGAHTGIGTLPIVFFGTHEQKEKYLPGLASGEAIAAYGLTETGAGSDAMNSKSKAVLNDEGTHYIINGTKQFITNGAFFKSIIVFAKINGEDFTAYIVDRDTDGLSIGPEEHKLGIRGSSTTQVILEDVLVPVENMLGKAGKGAKIAFNILNVGRLKLGIASIGGCKKILSEAIRYTLDRKQFGKSISEFGIIQEKLATCAIETYIGETMSYRTSGHIDELMADIDKNSDDSDKKMIKAIEEFNIEASILKIFGSECLDFVVDEALQMHGGYGFSQEYPIERAYRDARINRIFEGTNEINRMLIPGTLLKRSMTGKSPLMEFVSNVGDELKDPDKLPSIIQRIIGKETPLPELEELGELTTSPDNFLDKERRAVELSKRTTIYTTGIAVQRYLMGLANQQELLGHLADMYIDCYAMDSVLNRVLQLFGKTNPTKCSMQQRIAECFIAEAASRTFSRARRITCSITRREEELKKHFNNLDLLDPFYTYDIIGAKREIAKCLIEAEKYPL